MSFNSYVGSSVVLLASLTAFCPMRVALAAGVSVTEGGGYWDEATTWASGAVPEATDEIRGGGIVIVRDARTIGSVAVPNTTFELIVDDSDGRGASLSVAGHYQGNFGNYNAGRIDVRHGGSLALNTLELVDYGSGNNANYIYVTEGASLTASGVARTTSGKMTMLVRKAAKVQFDSDFELTSEEIRSGCTPNHELWWDGVGTFSVGGALKVMGEAALKGGRAAGSQTHVFLSGHPQLSVSGDFWMLETNRVDETETKSHVSELHFSAITPGKGGRPIVSVGGKAYVDGAVSIGKGDWIGVLATDVKGSSINLLSASAYDEHYAKFDRLEMHKSFTEDMATLVKSGNEILLVPALDKGVYTETLTAGTRTAVYGPADAAKSYLFRVQRQDPEADDIELCFQFSDSAFAGRDFMSMTAATKNLTIKKLEENEDGWTHKATLHGMKGTREFAVALDFSTFKFGNQPQNIGYMKQAMFGKKGSVKGLCVIVR